MPYDEQLANRIRRAFSTRQNVTERKMFGGLAFLVRGRMCCGIVANDLMVRIPDDEFDAVMRRRHVRPMDFTGKPLKGFVYVSASGLRTPAALRAWLAYGVRVAEAKAAGPAARRPRATTRAPGHPASPRRPTRRA
jgi:TfoX/Sxy family transcriptional regulator of competence genes